MEVCLSGTWGSVCGNQFWEDANARVVCSQLGHSPEGRFTGPFNSYCSRVARLVEKETETG